MTTNPNIKLATSFLRSSLWWWEYSVATAHRIKYWRARRIAERYSRAYRYLMRRAKR
jgi:hypothetical protein